MTLNELAHPAYTLPAEFDGFHVEIETANALTSSLTAHR
jgi:hypothetical protein